MIFPFHPAGTSYLRVTARIDELTSSTKPRSAAFVRTRRSVTSTSVAFKVTVPLAGKDAVPIGVAETLEGATSLFFA